MADSDSTKKGLHDAAEKPVRLDDYPERPYSEAMTKEQRAELKELGLL